MPGRLMTDLPENTKSNKDAPLPNASALARSVDFFKTLSNPHRLSILFLLRHGQYDVQHIQEALHISQPLASQHLKTLKSQGFLIEQRQGKHVYYALRSAAVTQVVMGLLQLHTVELAADSEIMTSLSEMLTIWAASS